MMNKRVYKYLNFISFELNNKFLSKDIVKISALDVTVKLDMVEVKEDPKFLGLYNILEMLGAQKPGLVRLKLFYKGTKKVAIGEWKLTLRKNNLYYFLDYFISIWFPIYLQREHGFKIGYQNKDVQIALSEVGGLFGVVSVIYILNKHARLLLKFKIKFSHLQEVRLLLNELLANK
jgi:hypothetical protein